MPKEARGDLKVREREKGGKGNVQQQLLSSDISFRRGVAHSSRISFATTVKATSACDSALKMTPGSYKTRHIPRDKFLYV